VPDPPPGIQASSAPADLKAKATRRTLIRYQKLASEVTLKDCPFTEVLVPVMELFDKTSTKVHF